jgi:hypothetical protein
MSCPAIADEMDNIAYNNSKSVWEMANFGRNLLKKMFNRLRIKIIKIVFMNSETRVKFTPCPKMPVSITQRLFNGIMISAMNANFRADVQFFDCSTVRWGPLHGFVEKCAKW